MVNMYSMGTGLMYGMNNNTAGMNGGNVHQSFKSKYGVGYEDFNTRPYAQPYPMAIIPRVPETKFQKSWLGRFIQSCFG